MTKVSVITPAYNCEDRVITTVDSAREQRKANGEYFTQNEIEIVVVNDGSTDNKERLECINVLDERVSVLTTPNMGGPGHRANNYGILHSSGDYLVRLDSDDSFLPGYIDKVKTFLDENPGIDFVTPNYEEYFEDTGETRLVDVSDNPFNSIAVGVMYRKDLLARVGIYDPSFFFAEYDLMHRILQSGAQRGHIEEPLFRYVRHSASQTASSEKVEEGRKQLVDKWGEFPMRGY